MDSYDLEYQDKDGEWKLIVQDLETFDEAVRRAGIESDKDSSRPYRAVAKKVVLRTKISTTFTE